MSIAEGVEPEDCSLCPGKVELGQPFGTTKSYV